MRVDAPQPPQTASAPHVPGKIRQNDLAVVADNDVADLSLAVDEDANLTADFMGTFGKVASQFAGDDLIGRHPTSANPFQRLELAGLESGKVAYDHSGRRFELRGEVGMSRSAKTGRGYLADRGSGKGLKR